ncbi:hypothetical protein D187_006842 [Cystobacter fuscus DSM 2262]|uniref:Uncharacterized protein n=1 Tax=Cystobacter fuscus (strain ATCC 25194 / DSM 2262 / NBRC 100088 / M29) TaxID=1242864 RepID=S9QKV3_CYSF2|nr:hypothetical protein D187_006842 [Cystobacter fuscus DSM 2262]
MSLLLCAGLVLPGVGRAAQESAPPIAAEERALPGRQDDAPRRLMTEEGYEDDSGEPVRSGAPRGVRILAEVGGGLVTSAALGLAGGLTGGLLCLGSANDDLDKLICLIPAGLGALVGVAVGFPLGVWWAGEAVGGNGSLLATLAGGLVGTLAGGMVLGVAAIRASGQGGELSPLATASLPLLGMAGCIVGYELSQHEPRRWAARGRLQPLLAVTPSGAVLGLSGLF